MLQKFSVREWASSLQRQALETVNLRAASQPIMNLQQGSNILFSPCIQGIGTCNSYLSLLLGLSIFFMLNWSEMDCKESKWWYFVLGFGNDYIGAFRQQVTWDQSGPRFMATRGITLEQYDDPARPCDTIWHVVLLGSSWYQMKLHYLSGNTQMSLIFARLALRDKMTSERMYVISIGYYCCRLRLWKGTWYRKIKTLSLSAKLEKSIHFFCHGLEKK